MPHDISAETGIICTLIHRPDFILHSEHLKPAYFYKRENKTENGAIYWAIQELYNQGVTKIDEFNLTTQINSEKGVRNMVESVGKDFVKEVIDKSDVLARDTLEEYKLLVDIVIETSFRRELYKELKAFENTCLSGKGGLNDLNLRINRAMDKIAIKYIAKDEVPLYDEKLDEIWQNIIDKRNADGTYGLLSKFPILKKYFTYQDGELVLFAARRKKGKSVIAMNELVHKLKQGVPCVYLDTEMKDELFTVRMVSHLTGFNCDKISSGNYNKEEGKQIEEALEWLKSVPFTHIYDPSWTRDTVYTTLKILKNKIDFKFLIYDYIKITDNNLTSSSEQYNELGNWCNFLKNDIAGEFDIPVLSMVQVNRSGNIADSDKIERYASTGVSWEEKSFTEISDDGKDCGNYKMKILFNRLGIDMDEEDYLDFVFDKESLSINECKRQHEKESPFADAD